MKCGRAFEADLVAVLRGESGDVEFLAHYPTCADCAAELRVWGELDGLLRAGAPVRGTHPEPDALLAYADAPATLATSARDEIERHLAACRSCADEIGSLRRFDPAGVAVAPAAAQAPIARAPRTGSRPVAPEPSGWVSRVLWHPAFAYALAALLLVPIVRDQMGKMTVPARVLDARHQERDAAAPMGNSAASLREAAKTAPQQMPVAPAAPPAAAPAPPAAAPATGRLRDATAELRAPMAALKRDAPAESAANEADARHESADGAMAGRADRTDQAAARGAAPGGGATGAVVVDLRVGEATVIPLALAELGPQLRIIMPGTADGPVEVQIRARAGARQLVQRLARRANAIAVPIPPRWLAPGDYTITATFPVAADADGAARRAAAPLTLGFSVGNER